MAKLKKPVLKSQKSKAPRLDKMFVDLLKHSREMIVESLTYPFNFM